MIASLVAIAAIAASGESLRQRNVPPPEPVVMPAILPGRPALPPRGSLFALRVLADAARDAPAVAQALGPVSLEHPPAGYRWLRLGSNATDRVGLIVGEERPMGGGFGGSMLTRFVFFLARIDAHEISERDLIDVKTTTDERERTTLVYQLSADGGRRLAMLTRANLPDDAHPNMARLAIVLNETVLATIPAGPEIRDGRIVDPGPKDLGNVQYAKDLLAELAATNDGRPSPKFLTDPAEEVRETIAVDIPVLSKANRVVIRWHDGPERHLDRPADIEALTRALHPRLVPMAIGSAFAIVSFSRDEKHLRRITVHSNGCWVIERPGGNHQTGIDPNLPDLIRWLAPP